MRNLDAHLLSTTISRQEARKQRATLNARSTKGVHIATKSSGEFFTPDKIIGYMTRYCDFSLRENYLDPACGNGNILLYIFKRKIEEGVPTLEALKEIYGVDLQQDNIDELKERFIDALGDVSQAFKEEAQIILDKNIKCADSLEFDYTQFADKFDNIIQNPPYSGQLYIKFFNLGLDLLSDSGKMVIICPSTWLINVRKTGNVERLFKPLKDRLGRNVRRVVIENYNQEFGAGMYVPFCITYIDKACEFEDIEFSNCGEDCVVKTLDDCNLLTDYTMIWRILDKVLTYGDFMKDHIYKPEKIKKEKDVSEI